MGLAGISDLNEGPRPAGDCSSPSALCTLVTKSDGSSEDFCLLHRCNA